MHTAPPASLPLPLPPSVAAAQILRESLFDSPLLARILGMSPLLEGYRRLPSAIDPAGFARHALEALAVRVSDQEEGLQTLPSSGPLLLTANHPFGGVEGLLLAAQATQVRPDLKILTNRILCRIPELRPLLIPVDVFHGRSGSAGNVSGLRAALRHLEAGGALAVFPSGVVSHRHARSRCVTDPAWNALVGRLARVAGVSTAPIYFEGRNSLLFQAAGCVHSVLRTMLLPREMWRMRGHNVRMRVGKAVETSVLSALADDEGRTAYIRACCYALKRKKAFAAVPSVPVASPGAKDDLLREIHAVRGSLSAEEGNFQVLRVRGDEAPGILHEIGRQREKTFRNAHEGSGKAVDIDRFDEHYVHLVLWDKAAERLAGSYRVRIFSPEDAWRNRKTLYTASLFRFKAEFFERCGLSMELGRAFIASEYQRDYAPLMLLWKGIARLAIGSRVRTLFGACSIGLDYSPESIFMLRRCLEERYFAEDLAGFVQGRRLPPTFPGPNEPRARGLDYTLLNRAVKGLEGGKGLPVLFKHYLQLGGRIAAFHEDNDFGTMDALMIVDLQSVPPKTLARYAGSVS